MEPDEQGTCPCPQPEQGQCHSGWDTVHGQQPWHGDWHQPCHRAETTEQCVCALCMGTGLSQSPAAPPHTSPSTSSRLFSLASSYLFKKEKTAAGSAFHSNHWREGLALSSSPFSRKMFLQTCCVENKMTFFSSHALVLICRPRHAATGRAGQLSTHE